MCSVCAAYCSRPKIGRVSLWLMIYITLCTDCCFCELNFISPPTLSRNLEKFRSIAGSRVYSLNIQDMSMVKAISAQMCYCNIYSDDIFVVQMNFIFPYRCLTSSSILSKTTQLYHVVSSTSNFGPYVATHCHQRKGSLAKQERFRRCCA